MNKKRIIFGVIGWTLAIVLGIMHFQQEDLSDFDWFFYGIGTVIAMAFIFPSIPNKKNK